MEKQLLHDAEDTPKTRAVHTVYAAQKHLSYCYNLVCYCTLILHFSTGHMFTFCTFPLNLMYVLVGSGTIREQRDNQETDETSLSCQSGLLH